MLCLWCGCEGRCYYWILWKWYILFRWNFYVNIDPKVIGGHIKIFRKYTWNFFEKPGNIMEFCQSGNVGTLYPFQQCWQWWIQRRIKSTKKREIYLFCRYFMRSPGGGCIAPSPRLVLPVTIRLHSLPLLNVFTKFYGHIFLAWSANQLNYYILFLQFATSAKKIKNKAIVNEVLSDESKLKRYKKQIMELTKELEAVSTKNKVLHT